MSTHHKEFSHASRLVVAALGPNGSLNELLKTIADVLESEGCVIWEVAPGEKLDSKMPSGRLFTLAAYFAGKSFAVHDLPLKDTVTGDAILTRETCSCNDFAMERPGCQHFEELRRRNINRILSVPFKFHDNRPGAIALYRTQNQAEFSPENALSLQQIAKMVAQLYQSSRDKLALDLMQLISELSDNQTFSKSPKKFREFLGKLCKTIAEKLNCFEASIILRSLESDEDLYQIAATTLPLPDREIEKCKYRVHADDGLTGYILKKQVPVRILDLRHFERDSPTILFEYPGITWQDRLKIEQLAMAERPPGALPPISFLGVPLTSGSTLLGVLKVCAANDGPYYFTQRDVDLLKLAGDLLSGMIVDFEARISAESENRLWQETTDGVGDLIQFVLSQSENPTADVKQVLNRSLSLIQKTIPQADVLVIRLADNHHLEVRAKVLGPAKNLIVKDAVQLTSDSLALGSRVFSSRKVYHLTKKAELKLFSEEIGFVVFGSSREELREAYVFPIAVGENVLGVLDLGTTGGRLSLPPSGIRVAQLIAWELGLYLTFLRSVEKIRNDSLQEQRLYDDLSHQLKGPVAQVFKTISSLVDPKKVTLISTNSQSMQILRGQARKAFRTMSAMRLLANTKDDNPLKLNEKDMKPIDPDWLVKSLIELAADTESLIDPDRNIRISINRDSFHEVSRELRSLMVDQDLLMMCLNNLFDNAAKYSYPNTQTSVEANVNRKGKLSIAVRNRGIVVNGKESNLALKRGWRSPDAKWTTGEGAGIGLWLADKIMQAHNGSVVLEPTANGITEAKLMLELHQKTI